MIQDSSDDEDNTFNYSSLVEVRAKSDGDIANLCNSLASGNESFSKFDSGNGSCCDSLHRGDSIKNVTNETKEQDAMKRKRLQIYAFVARCIAYPFSAKYRYEMNYKPPKLTSVQLQLARERFLSFIQGDLKIPSDEAFLTVVTSFYELVLKTDEITDIINGPGWTMLDFLEVFKRNVQKRLALLPEIKGISKTVLMNNWMEKFELIFRGESDQRKLPLTPSSIFNSVDTKMTKDQLFDLFQKILHVKKHQHQILFNILQLDNSDEQAAQVRRELDYRMHEVHELGNKNLIARCLTKEMDVYFAEELKLSIENLKASLQSVPVSKDDDDCKEFSTYQGETDRELRMLSKQELSLTFHVQIIIKDLKGLTSVDKDKVVFCLFEMNGCDKLSTNRTQASNLSWDVQADFVTNCPLPHVKVKLCQESSSLLGFDDKELARVNLTLKMSSCAKQMADWHKMQPSKNCKDKNFEIKLLSILEKPKNVKNFGYLYCQGKCLWKKWKKRYFLLVQVSQFTFLICSYQENKPESTGFLLLNDFTLDYCDPVQGLEGGRSYFTLTKEGDEVVFATEDEETLLPWMQTLYRATGQILKPNLPSATQQSALLVRSESERICRKLFDEIAQARPNMFDHQDFFLTLQRLTLEFRIKDPFICTYGWLSSDQVFVLDEYCGRYGVRVFMRHLGYLEVLMDHAYDKIFIDPSLLYQKFSFCVAHIHGNKPDRTYTVLKEEKDRFMEVAYKLFKYLEHVITNFRLSFPFGRPENGLKICLSLLERVLREINYFENKRNFKDEDYFAKEIIEPIPESQMHAAVKKCLEQSTYAAYDHITRNCNLEGTLIDGEVDKVKEAFMSVAESCIQNMHQITECHADAFCTYDNLINESIALLWNMFLMDLRDFLCQQPLSSILWNFFCLFQLINECCLSDEALNNGKFHKDLCALFAPIVLHYLENMEVSIEQSLHSFFKSYIWKPSDKACCPAVKDLCWKLECLGNFVQDLNWPDEIFLEHLKNILSSINYRTVSILTSIIVENFEQLLKNCKKAGDCYLSEELFASFNSLAKMIDSFPPDSAVEKHLIQISERTISNFTLKLMVELDNVLSELSKHDANKFFPVVFSFKKPEQLAKSYTEFIQFGLLQIERNIVGEALVHKILEKFLQMQVRKLNDWLSERVDIRLSSFQLQTLTIMWNKISSLFSPYPSNDEIFKSKECKTVAIRIEVCQRINFFYMLHFEHKLLNIFRWKALSDVLARLNCQKPVSHLVLSLRDFYQTWILIYLRNVSE